MAYDLWAVFSAISKHLQVAPTVSLDELQTLLCIDRHTLLRAVKAHSGKTFRDFRADILLEHITQRFNDDPLRSLKEISFATGYGSQRSLSRFVKAKTGMCPTQMRQQSRPD